MNSKTTNKISKKVAKKVVKRLKLKGIKKKRRKNRRRVRNVISAAYTSKFKKQFRIRKQDGNSMIVEGRDLIYSIPDTLITQNNTPVMTVIPSNPAYWSGTRVAALASGYQNFRPMYFKVTYVPQCAVTQQGNVIAGTLWNQTPSDANLQQSLRTSSGGLLTQCYKPASSIVRMKSNLQFNLFRMAGEFNQESNPFLFIALSIGCFDSNNNRIIPGYFYITYRYCFKNPIGTGISYFNSGLVNYSSLSNMAALNKSIINCSAISEQNSIELGSTIQLDDLIDGTVSSTINGQPVQLQESQLVWSFANKPANYSYDLNAVGRYVITYSRVNTTEAVMRVPPGEVHLFQPNDASRDVLTYANTSTSTEHYVITGLSGGHTYVLTTPYQFYGGIFRVEAAANYIGVTFLIPAEKWNMFELRQVSSSSKLVREPEKFSLSLVNVRNLLSDSEDEKEIQKKKTRKEKTNLDFKL